MTVRELISYLEEFPENSNVVIKVSNSDYLESVDTVDECGISSFWGKDRKGVVVRGAGQVGAICSISDIEENE